MLYFNYILRIFIFPKAGLLEKVETELHAFSDVLKKNQKFSSFLSNPTVAREAKCKLVCVSNQLYSSYYCDVRFLILLAKVQHSLISLPISCLLLQPMEESLRQSKYSVDFYY